MTLAIDIPFEELREVCRSYRVRRLMVFGSVLREDFGPESDVDLLVEFVPGARITYFDLADLQDQLAELLGRPVDLGTPASLSDHIREQVLSTAQVIYEHH
jgi:predicted nucleotidyltransferase